MHEHDDLYDEDELTKIYDREIFRRLIGYVKPYRRKVLIGLVLILIAEGARNVTPLLAKYAIDNHINSEALRNRDFGTVLLALRGVVILYTALLLLDLAASFLRTYMMQIMGQEIMRDMRVQLYAHIHKLHAAFFDTTAVGRLMTRVMNDIAALNELFASGIVDSIGSVIGLITICVMMFVVSWQFALVTLSVLPIIAMATLFYQVLSRRAYREWRRQLSRMNAFMNERIGGLTTLQLFNQEASTIRRFTGINTEYLSAALRAVMAMAFFGPLIDLTGGLATAVIIWYGGGNVIQNNISIGELFAFLVWGQRFFWPLRALSEQYNTLLIAMASSERVFTLFDTEPAVQDRPNAKPIEEFRERVEFRDVWFAYNDDDHVIRGISLTIERGERVAVVGATGSGKTTLTNLLCRFYDIQKGSILVDGVDVRDLRMADLRRRIAIVQQDVFLFSGSIADNIRLDSPDISDEQVAEAAGIVQADRFISSLPGGMDAEVKEGGSTFSSGQKQLVAFARALAFDPDILILDEATSSIDTETEVLIQAGLKRLLEGRTSIIIAHRLSTIQDADKIVVMHKGEIREVGTHTELLRERGIYYRLYQLQYRGQDEPASLDPEVVGETS